MDVLINLILVLLIFNILISGFNLYNIYRINKLINRTILTVWNNEDFKLIMSACQYVFRRGKKKLQKCGIFNCTKHKQKVRADVQSSSSSISDVVTVHEPTIVSDISRGPQTPFEPRFEESLNDLFEKPVESFDSNLENSNFDLNELQNHYQDLCAANNLAPNPNILDNKEALMQSNRELASNIVHSKKIRNYNPEYVGRTLFRANKMVCNGLENISMHYTDTIGTNLEGLSESVEFARLDLTQALQDIYAENSDYMSSAMNPLVIYSLTMLGLISSVAISNINNSSKDVITGHSPKTTFERSNRNEDDEVQEPNVQTAIRTPSQTTFEVRNDRNVSKDNILNNFGF